MTILESNYTDTDVKDLAIGALEKLKKYATEGLPACYNNSVDDFLWDFYPDLPWDFRMIESIDIILQHPEFPAVRQQWLDRFNFDWNIEFATAKEEEAALNAE